MAVRDQLCLRQWIGPTAEHRKTGKPRRLALRRSPAGRKNTLAF